MTEDTPNPQEQPEAEATVAPEAGENTDSPTAAESVEIGSASAVAEAPKVASVIRGKVTSEGVALGTGRRKTSVARVRIQDGSGKLTINGRDLAEYFTLERDQNMILAPLKATGSDGKVDIWVRVNGGGSTGQTGAVVLGIARALQAKDPELHHTLSVDGYLTRDSRMVERKKYGYKKARKSFQFSKR
jgi:small subunit ribosomal protein S9